MGTIVHSLSGTVYSTLRSQLESTHQTISTRTSRQISQHHQNFDWRVSEQHVQIQLAWITRDNLRALFWTPTGFFISISTISDRREKWSLSPLQFSTDSWTVLCLKWSTSDLVVANESLYCTVRCHQFAKSSSPAWFIVSDSVTI